MSFCRSRSPDIASRLTLLYLTVDWEDIGTVGAFHQANIDLVTTENPAFDFAFGGRGSDLHPVLDSWPLLAHRRARPREENSLRFCERQHVIGPRIVVVIENSVIGVRARVAENVTIRDTYIMGIDFLEHSHQWAENQQNLAAPPSGWSAQFGDRTGNHR